MKYQVYESRTENYANVHQETCSHCTDFDDKETSFGRWHGPYDSMKTAFQRAEKIAGERGGVCNLCLSSQKDYPRFTPINPTIGRTPPKLIIVLTPVGINWHKKKGAAIFWSAFKKFVQLHKREQNAWPTVGDVRNYLLELAHKGNPIVQPNTHTLRKHLKYDSDHGYIEVHDPDTGEIVPL